MIDLKNVDGHFYPPFHGEWGGFAEELFHYTSRYYVATEAFLRHLSQDHDFVMSGYRAALLSEAQRELMAVVLACRPDRDSASAAVSIVGAVIRQDDRIERDLIERLRERLAAVDPLTSLAEHTHHVEHPPPPGVAPLDPFLAIAERLQLPVAVRERHVEVSLHTLAEHLDSPNSALRTNLHNAVLQLHAGGYVLRNHPHLTHSEAQTIGDEGAV
ncbi:MAG: endonuclease [Chromatiaceae bacterium]|nr:endonuclease [Gammaproteobacteria bacterium]MCP5303958.1 endonuclease [Chromatiaceae bacterium]MCP5313685.1 endonuclease [Chromatiaceae bacterium]